MSQVDVGHFHEMANAGTEFVEVVGVRTQLRRGGDGPALLVVHGELGVPGWLDSYAALAQGFSVIVPSLPGYGQSSRPSWVTEVRDLAAWTTWFIRDLQLPKPLSVVGFSMGAWIAAEIATMDHSLFKQMVLVSPMGLKPAQGEIWDYFLNPTEEAFARSFHDPAGAPEYERYYGREWTPEEVEQAEFNRETTCRVAWRPYMYHPNLPQRLAGVSTPTLIIHGRQDRITPLSCAEIYHAGIEGSQLQVLEECGHLPEMEKPEEFLRAVRGFLTG